MVSRVYNKIIIFRVRNGKGVRIYIDRTTATDSLVDATKIFIYIETLEKKKNRKASMYLSLGTRSDRRHTTDRNRPHTAGRPGNTITNPGDPTRALPVQPNRFITNLKSKTKMEMLNNSRRQTYFIIFSEWRKKRID